MVLGILGGSWGGDGGSWVNFGANWRALGGVLYASWAVLAASWGRLAVQDGTRIEKKSIPKLIKIWMPLGIGILSDSQIFGTNMGPSWLQNGIKNRRRL